MDKDEFDLAGLKFDKPEKQTLVPRIAKLIQDADGIEGREVLALNVVYVVVDHDGTEEHTHCRPKSGHLGGVKDNSDLSMIEAVAEATEASARQLRKRLAEATAAQKARKAHGN